MSFEDLVAKIMALPLDSQARLLDLLRPNIYQVREAQPAQYGSRKSPQQREVGSMTSLSEHALQLSPAERAQLAYELLQSLDAVSEPDIDQEWLDEAARRAAQIDRGEVTLVPGEEVAKRARALLK